MWDKITLVMYLAVVMRWSRSKQWRSKSEENKYEQENPGQEQRKRSSRA